MSTRVELPPAPVVQLLGDAAVLRGAAALDAYRLITEGVAVVRRRDGIEPSQRLLEVVAVLKAASTDVRSDIADVRKSATRPQSGCTGSAIRTGELVGVEEVARMLGIGHRQTRRLAPTLGAQRTGRGWRFDRGLVQTYIDTGATA